MLEFLRFFFITLACSLILFFVFAFLLLKVPRFKIAAAYELQDVESKMSYFQEEESEDRNEWISGSDDEYHQETQSLQELEMAGLGVRRRVSSSVEEDEDIKDLNGENGWRELKKVEQAEWRDRFLDQTSSERTDSRRWRDLNDKSSKDFL